MCCVAILCSATSSNISASTWSCYWQKSPLQRKEANAIAELNNGNFCLPWHHWKSFQENKVIGYNQSNCTKAELLTCYCVSAKLRADNSTDIDYYLGHCIYGCFMSKFSQYYNISTESTLKGEKCALSSYRFTLWQMWTRLWCSQLFIQYTLCSLSQYHPLEKHFALHCHCLWTSHSVLDVYCCVHS